MSKMTACAGMVAALLGMSAGKAQAGGIVVFGDMIFRITENCDTAGNCQVIVKVGGIVQDSIVQVIPVGSYAVQRTAEPVGRIPAGTPMVVIVNRNGKEVELISCEKHRDLRAC